MIVSRKIIASFLAAAGMGLSVQTATADNTAATTEKQSLSDPAITLAVRDEKNNLACFESAAGFSCATPRPDASKGLPQITPLTEDGTVVARRIIDESTGIACYENTTGALWCGTLSADTSARAADISIASTEMGDMGATTRINDRQTGLVVYTNASGISGAVHGTTQPDMGSEKDLKHFNAVTMQRIRDYETGVTCYFAPAADQSFACATLAEDTTSGTDIRAILKVKDHPHLNYIVVDQGSNGITVNVGNQGVCTAQEQSIKTDNTSLDTKEIPTLTGTKVTRIIDEVFGIVTYSSPLGLSCGNIQAPKPQ